MKLAVAAEVRQRKLDLFWRRRTFFLSYDGSALLLTISEVALSVTMCLLSAPLAAAVWMTINSSGNRGTHRVQQLRNDEKEVK